MLKIVSYNNLINTPCNSNSLLLFYANLKHAIKFSFYIQSKFIIIFIHSSNTYMMHVQHIICRYIEVKTLKIIAYNVTIALQYN